MANPQPPIAPAPPPRSGSGSNYVLIALLLLALIVVAGGTGVWIGLRILSNSVHVDVERDGVDKNISIQTPLGSLKVIRDINQAGLGLPIYPGATQVKDNNSATVNIDIADQAQIRAFAGKFETPDSLDKVRLFYHDRLGDQVTKFTEKDAEGKTVFEIKRDNQDKLVVLQNTGDKTIIQLVHVARGSMEAN